MINVKAGSVVFEHVRITYGSLHRHSDLSINIEPGTAVTLLGPSGLRQDHHAAHAGRVGTPHIGAHSDWR